MTYQEWKSLKIVRDFERSNLGLAERRRREVI